ncbi:MAG: triose-phosphate isomerase [Bacteroidales bacterium]|nr:triose-phosphate isomerase [Bacteroidales bacterium]MCF8457404.1 triose-phosphate isomerase [Bacteroidales bacterium]
MRKKIVAGNWKMNNSFNRGIELATEINKLVRKQDEHNVTVILSPPYIHLAEIARIIDKDVVSVAAQNCAAEPKGAFTGEVSAKMIKSTGAQYIIIGHSERRQYYCEDNPVLKQKVLRALENSLTPIFCIGELLSERESGNHFKVVKSQLEEALFDLPANAFGKIVVAYEPVWAIGTGVTASSAQAQEMHAFIRLTIADKYGKEMADSISILYGGSCKPSNAKELFANPDVDGGLIGGAALQADDFFAIINSF